MCKKTEKELSEEPVLKTPEGKIAYTLRKRKGETEHMCFVIKRNEQDAMVIEFKCNEQYNTEIKWSLKLCKAFLKDLHEDKIEVLKVNDEENSVSIIGKLFSDGDMFAWRLPEELKGSVNVGEWLRIPYVNGIGCVYVHEIIPTYKLTFFPEKTVLKKMRVKGKKELMSRKDFWDMKNERRTAWKERKRKKKEMSNNKEQMNTTAETN